MEKNLKNILFSALLILAALLSFFFAADMASSPEAHEETLTAIDDKIETVLKLSAASTASSALISAIPDDTATPIAEKLADFTEYFLLILCVLYAEKYLLTVIGAGAFKVLIPIACLIFIVGLWSRSGAAKRFSVKLGALALCLFLLIPLSIDVSDAIYSSYDSLVDNTLDAAAEFSGETAELTAEADESVISSILSRVSDTVSGLVKKAANLLNDFVESLAVMIVTSCVIPVLVLLFFVWLIKLLTGADIFVHIPRRKKITK